MSACRDHLYQTLMAERYDLAALLTEAPDYTAPEPEDQSWRRLKTLQQAAGKTSEHESADALTDGRWVNRRGIQVWMEASA